MAITAEVKSSIIKDNAQSKGDTGSANVQVALITSRIEDLQKHFQSNPKDHHSRRGLLQMVGKRKRLLDYVRRKDVQEYRALIEKLGLRK